MIDTSERPLTVAAEKVERPPAECCCAHGPSAVLEATAVVNEAQPTPRGHIARWFVRIKPRQSLSPSARRAAVILRNGGRFFLDVSPGVLRTDGFGAATKATKATKVCLYFTFRRTYVAYVAYVALIAFQDVEVLPHVI